MMRSRSFAAAAALGVFLLGCGDGPILACTDELRIDLTPAARTLTVGQSLTPEARLSSCGGRERLQSDLSLTVADGSSVTVTGNGRSVMAVAPGVSEVRVDDARYGQLGTVTVTVVGAPGALVGAPTP